MKIDPADVLQVEMVPLSREIGTPADRGKWRYEITKNGEPTGITGTLYGREACYTDGLAEIRRLRGGRLL